MLSLQDVLRWLAKARAAVIDSLNPFRKRRPSEQSRLAATSTAPAPPSDDGEKSVRDTKQGAVMIKRAMRQPVPLLLRPIPHDFFFQRLQVEMRVLLETSERLHRNYAELVASNELARPLLDQLREKITHRLRRARARHIRHLRELEREFPMEDDEHQQSVQRSTCVQCRKNRAAKKTETQKARPTDASQQTDAQGIES
ncbi:hypothetical protein PINS_up008979 [Pythium insidiosum]|nr:hypothetical protein PINS_up008979 [Pythium insidiosum]